MVIFLRSCEIFGNAKWIDAPGHEAPAFRKVFTAKKSEEASISICGLGYFALYINGRKVSDDLLVPNASCYSKRDLTKFLYPIHDKISYRTYVMKYDVSEYLIDGKNVLLVMLGGGYYHQEKRLAEGNVSFGTPKLCFLLEKESGNVISDETVMCGCGFVINSNLFAGEQHDYNLISPVFLTEEETAGFSPANVIGEPESDYQYQFSPSDKVIRSFNPILIEKDGDTALYDTGINTVGYAVLKCSEKCRKITVQYAEDIYDKDDFGIHFSDGWMTDEFITDGEDREYYPRFLWHGFRYFRIKGPARVIRVDEVHSDIKITSTFDSDNEQLNWLYETFIHTQLCNMHSGVPSDCPHRERLGYTGDGQLCCEAAMIMLDSKQFYRKWLNDIADCQCVTNGHVQHTAPLMGGGGGPCGWGGAIVEVAVKYYEAYGDTETLEEFFPKMLKYADYIDSRCENGLVCREEEGGWCLGDWLPPEMIKIPEPLVNTCLYIGFMKDILRTADILGKQSEAKRLEERIKASERAVDIAYFSPVTHLYCGDIQGASSLALRIGLGDERTKKNVADKYSERGMYDTGIIATPALTEYLFESGEWQTAYNLMTSKGDVSFDYMRRNGATTLWENWNGQSSKNHPMFGAVSKCIFKYLLGIKQSTGSAGYRDVIISPCIVDGMNRCSGSIETESGKISVSYEKKGNSISFDISLAEGINGIFRLYDNEIKLKEDNKFTVNI